MNYGQPASGTFSQPKSGTGRHGTGDVAVRSHDFVSKVLKAGWKPHTWSVEQLVDELKNVPPKYYADFLTRNGVSDEKCGAVYKQCDPTYGKPDHDWADRPESSPRDPLGLENWNHFTKLRSLPDEKHDEYCSLNKVSIAAQVTIMLKLQMFRRGGPGSL